MGCNKLALLLPMLLAIYTMLGNTLVQAGALKGNCYNKSPQL